MLTFNASICRHRFRMQTGNQRRQSVGGRARWSSASIGARRQAIRCPRAPGLAARRVARGSPSSRKPVGGDPSRTARSSRNATRNCSRSRWSDRASALSEASTRGFTTSVTGNRHLVERRSSDSASMSANVCSCLARVRTTSDCSSSSRSVVPQGGLDRGSVGDDRFCPQTYHGRSVVRLA
jgi:hypothetical protein